MFFNSSSLKGKIMSKVMYVIFLFVILGLFFYIIYWDSPDQLESMKVPPVVENLMEIDQNSIENRYDSNTKMGISILDHFDYLFKLRQELFLHWGFFITVTIALYGFIFMKDKNSVELSEHLIAAAYTIFTVVIVFAFFKILDQCDMCVKDMNFLYKSEITKYPVGGLIRFSIDYDYMRTFKGCVVEVIFFLIPTYLVIYWSKLKVLIKNKWIK